MLLKEFRVKNFRTFEDVNVNLSRYSVIIGKNNSGKSNLLSAIRVLYDDLKYDSEKDAPKFQTMDRDESWLEAKFQLRDTEAKLIKSEYLSEDSNNGNTEKFFKIRKFLKGDKVRTNQSNIYGYENGQLSENLFYGAKNISEAKLGKMIYIPSLTTPDDVMKISSKSTFRTLIDTFVNKIFSNDDVLRKFTEIFSDLSKMINQDDDEKISLSKFLGSLNSKIETWKAELKMDFNLSNEKELKDIILKELFRYKVLDKTLNSEFDINQFGLGFQRFMIYGLLVTMSEFMNLLEVSKNKTDFSGDFTLILFEEPESFLHPQQQIILNNSLQKIALSDSSIQIIITTHSPYFISTNIEDLDRIIRLDKLGGKTKVFQISKSHLDSVIQDSHDKLLDFSRKYCDETLEVNTEEDIIKYWIYLDSSRVNCFFANKVLLCEGATEKVLFDYLFRNYWQEFLDNEVYVVDTSGKFNIFRFMELFGILGIKHSVLFDSDGNRKPKHSCINSIIQNWRNDYTINIDFFENDIEDFLGIVAESRKSDKAVNVMKHLLNGKIDQKKLDELREKLRRLLDI